MACQNNGTLTLDPHDRPANLRSDPLLSVVPPYCRTCAQVLGGRVEHLAAAWETQRRYGGVARPKVAGEDGEAAPPFRHFVPGGRQWAGSRRHAFAWLGRDVPGRENEAVPPFRCFVPGKWVRVR